MPGAWAGWASRLSGRSSVRWTAGSATAEALRSAGARAATSGDVVHLPVAPRWGAPPSDTGHGSPGTGASGEFAHVLAHELGHMREPLARPRFLLADARAHADADERRAHRFADDVSRFPSSFGDVGSVAAGVVDSLPVGGAAAGARQAVAQAASGAVDQVRDQVREHVSAAVQEVVQSLPGPAGQALAAALREGGSGALQDLAGQAQQALGQVTEGLPSADGLSGAARSVASGQGFDLGSLGAIPGLDGLLGGAQQAGAAAQQAVGGAVGSVTGAVTGAAGGPAAALAALAGAGHSLTHLPHETVDRIVEALEQRILSEIERRGGRYAGSF